jgi:hypothetical protein
VHEVGFSKIKHRKYIMVDMITKELKRLEDSCRGILFLGIPSPGKLKLSNLYIV